MSQAIRDTLTALVQTVAIFAVLAALLVAVA
jgi:hypothetical protein